MADHIDDGGPAYPAKVSINRETGKLIPHQFGSDDFCTEGMTLRDHFAASVIGHLACSPLRQENTIGQDAEYAYKVADAMLRARRQQ